MKEHSEVVPAAPHRDLLDRRIPILTVLATVLGLVAAGIAWLLTIAIAFFTNLAFFHRASIETVSPATNALGAAVIVVPVIGGLVVGAMARYGSKAIRGHGIPEAMEQVLVNESRIPPRMIILKPLSAAIAIGSGGPFGAEGPIIATGSALGSAIGQVLSTSADERKTLLASGAAAGMAATFGSPVSAVLLAIELLLFEYRARSVIPVAFAAAAATSVRIARVGSAPVFAMEHVTAPGGAALAAYVVIGALVGVCAVAITRAVYAIEDQFERLPIHWMWWPAIGGAVVGVVGFLVPRTLGVGYDNIEDTLRGDFPIAVLAVLAGAKLVSWLLSLGSGTSGGTLAPLFTIGGAIGSLLASGAHALAPSWAVDPRIGALVGMAAMFAGASRALLASVVFAFETTQQPMGLLPLLGGCSAAYFVSCLAMPNSIMTEKLARRGLRVTSEYAVDFLDRVPVAERMTREVVTLDAERSVVDARAWLASDPKRTHQGFPVLRDGKLVGLVTRRELEHTTAASVGEATRKPAIIVRPDHTLREAADRMVAADVGRLVVVAIDDTSRVVGIVTRSDLLGAHRIRVRHETVREPTLRNVRRASTS
jgi:H+/Cl- antiporter ClcA/predicted transcriptional regulator